MTPQEIQLIRESFALVARRPEIAALLFYKRLFEIDPSLRPLFPSDIEEQGRKLMQVLGAAVHLLDQPDSLTPVLEDLGRRHVRYGVRDEHYDTVGEALLATLGETLGERFVPAAFAAWASLYTFVASTMKNAANSSLANSGPVRRQTMAAAR